MLASFDDIELSEVQLALNKPRQQRIPHVKNKVSELILEKLVNKVLILPILLLLLRTL